MNFVEVKSNRWYVRYANVRNMVRTSFSVYGNKKTGVIKGHSLNLYLGKDLASSLNIQGGDKVKFFVEENNPKVWFIKKSNDGKGYTAVDIRQADGSSTGSYRIVMSWKEFVPTDSEKCLQQVKFERFKDGIMLYFSPSTAEVLNDRDSGKVERYYANDNRR